jgi:hypothetical protein
VHVPVITNRLSEEIKTPFYEHFAVKCTCKLWTLVACCVDVCVFTPPPPNSPSLTHTSCSIPPVPTLTLAIAR